MLSSDDEEQQLPPLLIEATHTNEEFEAMELVLEWPHHVCGSVPPSPHTASRRSHPPPCATMTSKSEPSSPPHSQVRRLVRTTSPPSRLWLTR